MERSFKKEVQALTLGEGETFRGEGILAVTKALLRLRREFVDVAQGRAPGLADHGAQGGGGFGGVGSGPGAGDDGAALPPVSRPGRLKAKANPPRCVSRQEPPRRSAALRLWPA